MEALVLLMVLVLRPRVLVLVLTKKKSYLHHCPHVNIYNAVELLNIFWPFFFDNFQMQLRCLVITSDDISYRICPGSQENNHNFFLFV